MVSACGDQYKGSFTNYFDKILASFDHLTPSVDIFYLMNIDKKSTFLDYLLPFSCKRSLRTTSKLNEDIVLFLSLNTVITCVTVQFIAPK